MSWLSDFFKGPKKEMKEELANLQQEVGRLQQQIDNQPPGQQKKEEEVEEEPVPMYGLDPDQVALAAETRARLRGEIGGTNFPLMEPMLDESKMIKANLGP